MKRRDSTDSKFFSDPERQKIHDTLMLVDKALTEMGYNSKSQIGLYLMTEDKSYITTFNKAREAMLELDRDEVLNHLLSYYFEN